MAENIARMDKRVALRQPTATQNGTGATTYTYTTLATVWARVTEESGSEGYEADTRVAKTWATFKIRYVAGLGATWQLTYNNATWQIDSIVEAGRHEIQIIKAYKKDNTNP